ncbi:MAG: PINc/VapC family ATPase [Candidatus Nanoarchaeia archaeon]|nr:PINc/VapC family ATPase [Candidatus Haiyanarchaeum thermophilum]MCW1303242.1 PINc/VapC family ATPase [Candidatus Haiyanarchaeum thermophilum]MCW1304026.1 PINc/VapC family ATPase [Candidatus Haiyanarchaeum thermophilum]MCW1306402.1 PINc/VapC family ATPase [Candidatus Haiyanarchaeum thermophilum]MCW1307300.1 PINc/VapC family ATPase [Candidatus Haiyanarchaeum thermophilum]
MEDKLVGKFCPDTSVIIEGILSKKIKDGELAGKILIHRAVIGELEHQANVGKPIGLAGLAELKELRELERSGKIEIELIGSRPKPTEIKAAKLGEIDSLIRESALEHDACLITSDLVQAETAKAEGLKVIYIKPARRARMKIEDFFDENTMSVHLKEGVEAFAKKGKPGDWKYVKITSHKLSREELEGIARDIIEFARENGAGFIEHERRGSTIIQVKNYRILITRPPFSDGLEITAARPIIKLSLEDYDLPKKLIERLEKRAEGILIAGAPGMGKSCFAQALAEFYLKKGKVVKTIESPRDLQLPDEITQYSKVQASSEEIHDILLLSRPDYTIFDEMRDDPDFKLYSDLRLAGVGMVGVVHATEPIDAIQRFVRRVELGMIPSILDTVIFIRNGVVEKVYELKMVVKLPTGMKERDLTRPVVEIRDFLTGKLEYELYTFGEETIVVPIKKRKGEDICQRVREMLGQIGGEVEVEITNGEVVIRTPKSLLKQLIAGRGKRLRKMEKKLGIRIRLEPI